MVFVKSFLESNLKFPVLICRRQDHYFYADYWQAYLNKHRWDIECQGPQMTSLVGQYFKGKRIAFYWSGVSMTIRERIFGLGFHLDQTFLNSIFDDDSWNFSGRFEEDDTNLILEDFDLDLDWVYAFDE